jgi:hypothetical protein
MNTFKKNSLSAAVVAGLAAVGFAGSANAVTVNPDGLGQVLLFPYYTARANYNTLMTVVNTQSNYKIVKVRYLEGKNSREVLDFNLFLSPQDVWTGAIVQTTNGARLVSNDNSCVTPRDLFAETRNEPSSGLPLNEFKNFGYTGANADAAAFPTLDRTREGYFEVIEMGTVTTPAVQTYIKHVSGVPGNCAALDGMDPGSGAVAPNIFPGTFLAAPAGGLAGRASIINSANGSNYTFEPTAVDAWSNVVNYSRAGLETPSLENVAPLSSTVFVGGGIVTATWGAGRDAMSAVLTRDTLMNEFILDAGTASLTDWVITFPTKRYYIDTVAANQPFSNAFSNAGSCDPYGFSIYNREEGTTGAAPNVILPSPRPPVSVNPANTLCWEANVLPFGASSLLGSTNTNALVASNQTFANGATTTPGSLTTPALRSTQGPNGWALMSFQSVPVAPATLPNQRLVAPAAFTATTVTPVPMTGVHVGVPVIGAMFQNYNRTGVVSTYGGVSGHKYTRQIL